MKWAAFSILLCALLAGRAETLWAQDEYEDAFEDWLNNAESEFYTYLDSIDLEFAQLLEEPWHEVTVQPGIPSPQYMLGLGMANAGLRQQNHSQKKNSLFFGQSLSVPDLQPIQFTFSNFSEKQVADAWRNLFRYNLTTLYTTFKYYSSTFTLNDWGQFQLIRHTVQTCYTSASEYEQSILLFYLLVHSGYQVKLGYTDGQLVLLVAFEEELYELPAVQIEKKKYYLIATENKQVDRLVTSLHNYPKEIRPVSLALSRSVSLPQKELVKKRFFENTGYPLTLELDKNVLNFYASYPPCSLRVYIEAEPSANFKKAIKSYLQTQLAGKDELGKITFLLHLVQHISIHKPDEEVHGMEKYYFPEELFYYPYSDCEDYTILLSWLIKNFTSCQRFLLYYPQHVALGVNNINGYSGPLLYHNDKEAYFICDPSYKGGAVGEVVPKYKYISPQSVVLK